MMKPSFLIVCIIASASLLRGSDYFLVEKGQPRAEIVISETLPRTVRLAADDLQSYVEKMTGAHLPIVTDAEAGSDEKGQTTRLYLGRSRFTDELGITAEGLRYGAYRIVSGDGWMVFIGDDSEFTPREPWPRSNKDIATGDLQRSWEAVSKGPWKVPDRTMWKDRRRLPASVGLPDATPRPGARELLDTWFYDERGTFNAVSAYLQKLGVRWLMPGELGEFYPKLDTIPLAKIDERVEADFEIRQFSVHGPNEWAQWGMRLGVRYPYGMNTAHGLALLNSKEIFDAHPDWFSMVGGKRHFGSEDDNNHLCLSNPELFQEVLRCVRAQFDVYDYEGVSVMPLDAYLSICQCPLCEGKQDPDRFAERGSLSNHVWDFVNRIAKEIAKTHPGKLIYCCAYGQNSAPPTSIDKLEPNVQVVIVGGRRPRGGVELQDETRVFRESWLPKTDRPIQIYENYPMTSRGWYLPAFMARTIGNSINETKGYSRGEEIWITPLQNDVGDLAFNTFQYYFSAKMFWGGKERSPEALLDEYCELMYGEAAKTMKSFFDYCEQSWMAMETEKDKVDKALSIFEKAKTQIDSKSAEGQRLAYVDDFLKELRSKSEVLGRKQGVVPKLRLVGEAADIVIDGKSDEAFWENCNPGSIGSLREVQTGLPPAFDTTFKAGWYRNSLYFAVRCEESPGGKPNIATQREGDHALWSGDVVEFLIQTDSHSYYQIAVNPAGVVVDMDRGATGASRASWSAEAEVATHVGDGFWNVEIRIPVSSDDNDPLHEVVGRVPSASLPWYVNVCRQRVRDNGSEFSTFAPTSKDGFHDVSQFAHLYAGLSHTFEADPAVRSFHLDLADANKLPREEALPAYITLAEEGSVTDFQKSVALRFAAEAARSLKDLSKAIDLTAEIPLEEFRKAAEMQNLLAERKPRDLLDRFAEEDLDTWSFWPAVEGRIARSSAYHSVKEYDKAIADLEVIPRLTTNSRILKKTGETLEKLRAAKAAE